MDKYASSDNYSDPRTGVLYNRLGITDAARLEAIEAGITALVSSKFIAQPLPGNFDLAHLKAIHKHLFGEIYDWAGCVRTIDISKGRTRFANCRHIESAAKTIFDQLHDETCLQGLSPGPFARRAAYYLGEINVLHPFREGNGRAQREFISHLAYAGDHFIDWSRTDQKTMIAACIASYEGNELPMVTILEQCLESE